MMKTMRVFLACANKCSQRAALVACLRTSSAARIHIINSRAKHLQSQGCVEQGNFVAKQKLETWQARLGFQSWVSALPFIVLAMHKQHHSALPTRMSPYEVMLGQKSRWETRLPYGAQAPSHVKEMVISSSDDTE
jgi:hypothetical protein